MTILNKILIGIGAFLTIGLLSIICYQQIQLNKQAVAMQTQITAQKTLIDGLTRSSSALVTKEDLAALLASNGVNSADLAAIKSDMSSVKATLAAANVITVNSTPTNTTNLPSSSVGPANPNPPKPVTENCPNGGTVTCPNSDPFGYTKAPQNLTLNEKFGTLSVPFGQSTFDASKVDPWSLITFQREYVVTNVIGTDQNQKATVYNKFAIKVNGQTYTAPVTTATTETIIPTASWSFNPKLHLGVDTGIDVTHLGAAVTPNATVQVLSYGTDKVQPDLSVLQVGGGYNTVTRVPELVIRPVSFNIGKHIPLMSNLFVGPSLQLGTDGNVILGLGLHTSL